MRCGAEHVLGPCVLTSGHTGQHWNVGVVWGTEAKPERKKKYIPPPPRGAIEDVRLLRDTVRKAAMELVLEGVQLHE